MTSHNDFVGDVERGNGLKEQFFVDPMPLLVSSQLGCPTFTSMMQWGPKFFAVVAKLFLREFYDILVQLCNGRLDFIELYLALPQML